MDLGCESERGIKVQEEILNRNPLLNANLGDRRITITCHTDGESLDS